MAGATYSKDLQGENLSPYFLKNVKKIKNKREYVVSELNQKEKNKPKGNVFVGRMVVTSQFKYFLFDGGEHPEQFFDLKNDPGELKSLIHSKKYRKQIAAHRQMLRDWILNTDDNFPLSKIPLFF
jgi:arylsulfatase A-like enzyme